jgi:iron complex transport system substrate-binding protein
VIGSREDGTLEAFASFGALTQSLDDLGLRRTALAQAMVDRGVVWGEPVSAEIPPELDAGVIFDTCRTDIPDSPVAAAARMAAVAPGYCRALRGCREGRYVLLPRDQAGGISFRHHEMMVHFVVSHPAGRPSISAPAGG